MNHPLSSILSMNSGAWASASHADLKGIGDRVQYYRALFRAPAPDQRLELLRDWMPVSRCECDAETGATKFTQHLTDLPARFASPSNHLEHTDDATTTPLETESVVLPIPSTSGHCRHTLCVSSQVGCAMGCTFCETAQMGLLASLRPEHIVGQWFAARHHLGLPISNIVFMGMGEPLDNIESVMQAIGVLTDPNGPAIAPGRIAVSTVGRPYGIRRLAAFARQPGFHKIRLAVSINAPNDTLRTQLMPINRAYPLADLMAAVAEYPTGAGRRVLIEYVLIPGVNDDAMLAQQLADLVRPIQATINIIPYNPRRRSPWPAPTENAVAAFMRAVHEAGAFVKRRRTLGRPVMAACGQLGNDAIRHRRVVPSIHST